MTLKMEVAQVPLTILIVDDTEAVRRRLVAMISELRSVRIVGEAVDVPTAVNAVVALRPDVVVLDIRMPGGSGIDVLRYIRGHLPKTRVLMLTSLADAYYRGACLDAGADYFLDKSTEFERIPEILKILFCNRNLALAQATPSPLIKADRLRESPPPSL